MRLPGFVGGSNVLSSTKESCERSINLRPETAGPGFPKDQHWLPRTPGLRLVYATGDVRPTSLFTINGRTFGAAGTELIEQFEDDSYTILGVITAANDDFPIVTMASNGSAGDQLMITSGGDGFILTLSTNVLAAIIDPHFPSGEAMMCEFFGGYFFVLIRNSRRFQWSELEDGTAWDGLDVAERSWAADNISFLKRVGTHIWLVGTQTSEVWYATGDSAVFAPAQESLIEHGCIAPFSGTRVEQTLVWLDQDERGAGMVVVAEGYTPERISTYAIDLMQQAQFGVLQNAVGFCIQMQGHIDYVLNNASGTFRTTPVFDMTERLWHERAHWDAVACQFIPWVPFTHTFNFQRHFVGDRRTGAVYELSMDYYDDELADVP